MNYGIPKQCLYQKKFEYWYKFNLSTHILTMNNPIHLSWKEFFLDDHCTQMYSISKDGIISSSCGSFADIEIINMVIWIILKTCKTLSINIKCPLVHLIWCGNPENTIKCWKFSLITWLMVTFMIKLKMGYIYFLGWNLEFNLQYKFFNMI